VRGNNIRAPYNEERNERTTVLSFVAPSADLGMWEIIQSLRPVPLAIIVILVLFSLLSWTIVFSKSGVFRSAGGRF
jgi:hypothetical protein